MAGSALNLPAGLRRGVRAGSSRGRMNRVFGRILTLVLAAGVFGCQSDSKSTSATAKTTKPRRTYSAPVYQTGSLIPINRGSSSAGDVRSYSNTNKAPINIDTQRLNSGAPAGVRGN